MARFIPENRYELDLDSWDKTSRHFGLFRVGGAEDDDDEQPIGYMRVAEGKPKVHSQLVWVVAAGFPALAGRADEKPPVPFPLMSYFPDAPAIERLHRAVRRAGDSLVESSHLVVDPAARTLPLSRHIIECAIAIYVFHLRCERAIGCCDGDKISFYELFGFRHLPGTVMGGFLGIGERLCCAAGNRAGASAFVAERLTKMAIAYGETGEICFLSRNPNWSTRETTPQWANSARVDPPIAAVSAAVDGVSSASRMSDQRQWRQGQCTATWTS